jgi:uncharacterized SAM-binding protein YcdF (DUF218 family)
MTIREQFMALLNNDRIVIADAIIVLEGDGYNRIDKARDLWKGGWAPLVVISGGSDNPSYGSYPSVRMKQRLQKAGVPAKYILLDEQSQNTKEQAEEVMRLAKEKKWKRLILVASHYHQYRAFLTFLKAMQKSRMKLILMNAPSRGLSWFKKTPWGRRIDLLDSEFERINAYRKKGDVASFADAIVYMKWKESKIPVPYSL